MGAMAPNLFHFSTRESLSQQILRINLVLFYKNCFTIGISPGKDIGLKEKDALQRPFLSNNFGRRCSAPVRPTQYVLRRGGSFARLPGRG